MLSRYYSSPAGGLREITAVSSICTTAGRALMAAAGMEGGEGRCQVLHLAQRCEDDLGGLSLPGCRERERGRAILLLLNDPALMHTQIHTHTLFRCLEGSRSAQEPHLKTTLESNTSCQRSRRPEHNRLKYVSRQTIILLITR